MPQRSRHGRTTETRSPDRPRQGRAKQRAFCIASLEEGDALSELRQLLVEREPLYALADLTVDTDRLDLLETIWALEAWANEPA